MQQLVERRRGRAPLPPEPAESLEAQLEASIRTPPVGRTARAALLTLVLSLAPLACWATMTTMERAVIAGGQLVPEGRRKTVNLLEPGILRRLEVREGQVVREGQTLLHLDVTQAEAAAGQARAQVWSGRARLARLRAEAAEQRAFVPPELAREAAADPAVRAFLEAERALFAARWSAFDGQVAVQERQVSQFQEQVAGARAQRDAAQSQIRSTRDQIASLNQLLKDGFASRFRVLEMQRMEQGYLASLGQAQAQEMQLREAIAQAQRQLSALRLNRLSEIATDTQSTEAAVAAAEQQLRAAAGVLARREVVAPEDGKVTNIRAFTPGASIAAGDPVLDLVPAHDRFVAEAQVQPNDIEQVEVGQRVHVRLSSYRMRTLPLLPGRVIQVAADAQTSPQGATFYLVRAEMDLDALGPAASELALSAGMPAEVYVLGERRTPLDYFWSPLRNSARRTFRD
jgi:membrane fusion protein, type I secretion system